MNQSRFILLIVVLILAALPVAAESDNPFTREKERREAEAKKLEPYTAGEMAHMCASADALVRDGPGGSTKLSDGDLINAGLCASYFSAMNETLTALDDLGVKVPGVCVPPQGLTGSHVKAAFMSFIERHPDSIDSRAMAVALIAWADFYPCPQ